MSRAVSGVLRRDLAILVRVLRRRAVVDGALAGHVERDADLEETQRRQHAGGFGAGGVVECIDVRLQVGAGGHGDGEPHVEGVGAAVVVADAGVGVDDLGRLLEAILRDAHGDERGRVAERLRVEDGADLAQDAGLPHACDVGDDGLLGTPARVRQFGEGLADEGEAILHLVEEVLVDRVHAGDGGGGHRAAPAACAFSTARSRPKLSSYSAWMRASSSAVSGRHVVDCGELGDLLAAVDVRQRCDATVGSARIHARAIWPRVAAGARFDEELQLLDLLDAVEEPRARAVAAVVVLGEDGVLGVVALEEAAAVRHAGDDAGAGLARSGDVGAAGILLEHVVDDLHAADVTFAGGAHALVAPSRWPGRGRRRTSAACLR